MSVRRVVVALVLLVGSAPAAGAAAVAGIPYDGGPVLHSNRTHVIFWQPVGSGLSFDPGYTALVDQFLTGVAGDSHATSNLFAITGEYTDGGGAATYASTFRGSTIDSDALPANGCSEPVHTGPGWTHCLTDSQIQSEINHVVAVNHLPRGGTDIYFLVMPNGLGSCEDASSANCALGGHVSGYCGYHSSTVAGLLYAVIPYNAVRGHCQSTNPRPNDSTADPALSTIAHELAETVTDPLGDGWIDSQGNEIADVCINDYGRALGGTGSSRWNEVIGGYRYWLQELYSRLQNDCEPRPRPDSVSIDGSSRVVIGRPISLIGEASQPGGSIRAYHWSFGDGRSGRSAAVSHTYARVGQALVTLRVTDQAGNWAYASRAITITPAPGRGHRR